MKRSDDDGGLELIDNILRKLPDGHGETGIVVSVLDVLFWCHVIVKVEVRRLRWNFKLKLGDAGRR